MNITIAPITDDIAVNNPHLAAGDPFKEVHICNWLLRSRVDSQS